MWRRLEMIFRIRRACENDGEMGLTPTEEVIEGKA